MDDLEDFDAELAAGSIRMNCPRCKTVIPLPVTSEPLRVECTNGHAFAVKLHFA